MTILEQPRFLHGEMAITADTRDFPNHLTGKSLPCVSRRIRRR